MSTMRIARIRIQHFRSIKELDVELGPYWVLIGENNAGKSNILRALNLVVGETWPTERSFSDEDFHQQDTSKEIVIQVFFDETIPQSPKGHSVEVGGFQLCCKAYKRKQGSKPAGSLHTSYICISKDGKPIKEPPQQLRKGEQPKGVWLEMRVNTDLRERIPFIYVDVLREYDRQTPSSRWSVLRKLFNEVNAEFLTSKDEVVVKQPDGTDIKMRRRDAFDRAVRSAFDYLRTPSFTEIESKLAANVKEQMGIVPGEGDVSLEFAGHDPTHVYKSLQLYVDQMGITSPAGEVGAGLQSAIVVAIFRTYEQFKKEGAVFAIEEPEVFLHPQKARYFEGVLQGLASSGNQVILTTHSPVFVRVHQPESVAIIRRTQQDGTSASQTKLVDIADDERRALRLLTEFDAQRNELFFARKVFLVEGATEKLVLPLVFRALGYDINRLGISVIECGGKTKIPIFVRVTKALGIPYVVLADHDVTEVPVDAEEDRQRKLEAQNRDHERRNSCLAAVCDAGRLFWMKPTFEAELGLPRDDSTKIDRALAKFSSVDKNAVPTCLSAPIDALMA